jgi:hypothetical protein
MHALHRKGTFSLTHKPRSEPCKSSADTVKAAQAQAFSLHTGRLCAPTQKHFHACQLLHNTNCTCLGLLPQDTLHMPEPVASRHTAHEPVASRHTVHMQAGTHLNMPSACTSECWHVQFAIISSARRRILTLPLDCELTAHLTSAASTQHVGHHTKLPKQKSEKSLLLTTDMSTTSNFQILTIGQELL